MSGSDPNERTELKIPTFEFAAWSYYARRYRGRGTRIAAAVSLSVAQSLLVLPMAYVVKSAFDSILARRHFTVLAAEGLALLLLQLANGGLSLAARHISLDETKRVIRALRTSLLSQAYAVCSPFAATADRAWLHTAIVNDTERVDVMSNALLVVMLPAAITSAVLTLALFVINFWLAAVALVLLFLAMVPAGLLGRTLRRHVTAFRKSFERFSQGILFALGSMELTRVRGAQDWEQRRQLDRAEDLRVVSGRMAWLATANRIVQSIGVSLCAIVTLVAGGSAVAAGRMSLGDLASFYFVLGMLGSALSSLWSSIPEILTGAESLSNIHGLVRLETASPYSGSRRITIHDGLSMEAASFSYERTPILSKVSIGLARGSFTTLLGANGVGKTTVAYLMMGLIRPQEGGVCADGVPLDALDVEYLRSQIGFVMEQPWIFSGTIRENVAYGRPDATDREILEACDVSTAATFIKTLPRGLDTLIGEGGVSLSAGQCQRIAIARALLLEPAVLILDEPTSHLDGPSVESLFARLRAMASKPAILLITHDSKLAVLAERVYELLDGALLPLRSGLPALDAPLRESAKEHVA